MALDKTLFLVRGLPGSGKSTLAKMLCPRDAYEADDWFIDEGVYRFDPSQLHKAHHYCQTVVKNAMQTAARKIAVANTFSQLWEMTPYEEMASRYGYTVQVIECHGSFGSIHNVPESDLEKMKERWERISFDTHIGYRLESMDIN